MFILDIHKLLPGDIVLITETRIRSRVVRKATSSSFSHAILYLGGSSYIHSDLLGVHSGNLQRLLFKKQAHALVLRARSCNELQIANICMFARAQIGKEYSLREAMRSKINRNKDAKVHSNRQFCSRLISQAYADAGIQIVRNSDYCYPQDIAESPLMTRLENCVRRASDEEILATISSDPTAVQTKTINTIFKNTRILTKTDIQSFEQLTSYLITNPHHDFAISKIVQDSGYLSLWQIDIQICPWHYNSAEFVAVDMPLLKKLEYANTLRKGAINSLNVFIFMHKHHTQLWHESQLQYFAHTIALYTKLIELAKIRIATAEYALADT